MIRVSYFIWLRGRRFLAKTVDLLSRSGGAPRVAALRAGLALLLLTARPGAQAAPGDLKWSFPTGGAIATCPALDYDGTVYVGSTDWKVYALEGPTGAKKREFLTGGEVRSSTALGADGTVYVGLSLEGGSAGLAESAWPKFRRDGRNTGNAAENPAPPLLADIPDQTLEACARWTLVAGLTNAGSVSGPVSFSLVGEPPPGLGIDTNTGVVSWRPAQDQAPSTNHVTVRVSDASGAGDERTFTLTVAARELLRWEYSAGAAIDVCPAIGDDGTVYVVSADHRVHALDPVTGRLKWGFDGGNERQRIPRVGAGHRRRGTPLRGFVLQSLCLEPRRRRRSVGGGRGNSLGGSPGGGGPGFALPERE